MTDLHVPGLIRTRDSIKRAVAHPRLRPRGHWDRRTFVFIKVKTFSFLEFRIISTNRQLCLLRFHSCNIHYGSHTDLLIFKMFCVGLYNGELRDSQRHKDVGDYTPHKMCVHVLLKKFSSTF
jgi:hypothetical protein